MNARLRSPAPKARNVVAWAIGPGVTSEGLLALKARNDVEPITIINTLVDIYFALTALPTFMTLTQGVALGYYISRLWRWDPEF